MKNVAVQNRASSNSFPDILDFLRVHWLAVAAVLVILFLALFHLSSYPVTWFDEGSHLHVPKTLVRFGVYADYSSEGYRYYGPTTGVGPTVFLPIALAFRLFGIGLFQARFVIVLYLLAAIAFYYLLSRKFGSSALAAVATGLLITSRGVGLLEYGRQVLGEVPGFFFMLAGLVLWFSTWTKPDWKRLAGAGLLLGLSLVTKNQYLIVLGPGLGAAFLANLFYYKSVPQRAFIITGSITLAVYLAWQAYQIFALGPATAGENLVLFRQATTESALIFSSTLMKRAVSELLSLKVYFGLLIPALAYGLVLSLPRKREGLQWGVLFLLTTANLAWYILASISWIRYAFPALAFSALFVAKLFFDLTGGLRLDLGRMWASVRGGSGLSAVDAGKGVLVVWLAALLVVPFAQNLKDIVLPPDNAPAEMAAYMNQHVDLKAVVETWEPEMGFLSDHNYHFPPPGLLYTANSFIWLGKVSPATKYDYVQKNLPDYVLTGAFSNWVQLYPADFLASHYREETAIGGYVLFAKK